MTRDTLTIAQDIRVAISRIDSWAVPAARPVRRAITRDIRSELGSRVFAAALDLIHSGDMPRWFVYELVHNHAGAMSELNVRNLERLGEGLDSWEGTDSFACYLSGPSWRNQQIRDSSVHKWAKSRDRWWRRVAVVSTIPLNNTARGGTGDAVRTLAVCDLLVSDRDDMIVKAMSWALRELSQKCPTEVTAYVDANREVLAARVIREVESKLTTGLKRQCRKS
ncbi:MAG: DNA alkylation repair protein [Pirellulaceae bacterium]